MKFSKLFLGLGAVAAWSLSASAQILVGAGGAGPITFATAPATPGDWATTGIGGTSSATYNTPGDLDTAMNALAHTDVTGALATTAANGTSAGARYNSAGQYLVTQTTGAGAVILKAVLRNAGTMPISHLDVTYDFGIVVTPTTEDIPGHRVHFSSNGVVGSWQSLPNFSGLLAAGPVTSTLFVGAWLPGQDIYLLWGDDNSVPNPDGGYSIDNFQVSNLVFTNAPIPPFASVSSPGPGQVVFSGVTPTANVVFGGDNQPVFCQIYLDDNPFGAGSTVSPYSEPLTGLTFGTHTIYAEAVDNLGNIVYSTTNTFTFKEEFALLASDLYTQDFDSMGVTGTETPTGWYVGAALPAATFTVTAGTGSAGPNGAIFGWNYGVAGVNPDTDRALGTACTGGDRNTVIRLKNTTVSNVTSFTITYDGETWRTHNDAGVAETNNLFYSLDLGATWVALPAADYQSPIVASPSVAVDGNDAPNRVGGITTGVVTPALPISPNGVIYVRWFNFNQGGTDGGIAVDNFSFQVNSFSEAVLFVAVTSPTNGQSIAVSGCTTTADITVNAVAGGAGGSAITNVAFQLDGGTAVNDTAAPFSTVLTGAAVGPHTITVTAQDALGGTISTMVNVTVTANPAPVVTIGDLVSTATPTTPSSTGTVFLAGSSIAVNYTVTDNNLASVEFFVNDRLLRSNNAAFAISVDDAYAGVSSYTVRATDLCGLITTTSVNVTATNPPLTMLVTNGSLWRYYNTNATPPVDNEADEWFSPNYDDTVAIDPAWGSGYGELGGGDGPGRPERTIIDIGPANPRYNAIYYRHVFNVGAGDAGLKNLLVASMHDDGAVYYLNGTQIAVFNMGAGPYTYASAANNAVAGDGAVFYVTNASATLLVGNNTLAVEVHQNAADSSDHSFDAALMLAPIALQVSIVNNGNGTVTLSVPAGVSGTLISTTDISQPRASWTSEGPISDVAPVTQAHGGTAKFYAVSVP